MTASAIRLSLRPLSSTDAQLVLRGVSLPGQSWARDYPTFIDSDLLRALVFSDPEGTSTTVFGQYQIQLHAENLVIGGAGFAGPPDEFNAVEISFGVVPDYVGRGYGAEVTSALIDIARTNGATFVIASARPSDLPLQAAFAGGGLQEIVRDDSTVHFGVDLRH